MARDYFFSDKLRAALPLSQDTFWRIEAGLLGALLWLFRRLPMAFALWLAGGLFALAGPHTPRARKVADNLRIAFAGADERRMKQLVRASFAHVGKAAVELGRLDQIWRHRDRRLEFVPEPGLDPAVLRQRAVFVTAHVGAWQLTPLTAMRYGQTVPIIYSPEENPYIDRKLGALRASLQMPLVPQDGGIRVLMQALDQGHSIGLTLDTRLNRGELLPFFGVAAETNTMPARLALRYHCSLLPVWAERLPGARFRIHLCPPVVARDPDADAAARATDMTAQLNALAEGWIRAMPGQWLCFARRWPRRAYRDDPL